MFALQRTGKNAEPHCVYWENSQEEGGFWLEKGCITNLKSSNETHLTCECYHLTNFAVLMSVTDAADNVNVRTLFSRAEARIQEKKKLCNFEKFVTVGLGTEVVNRKPYSLMET